MRALAIALVERRDKLSRIVAHLSACPDFGDYGDIDSKGRPKRVKALRYLRYGVNGLTFEDIAELLEDTAGHRGRDNI